MERPMVRTHEKSYFKRFNGDSTFAEEQVFNRNSNVKVLQIITVSLGWYLAELVDEEDDQ